LGRDDFWDDDEWNRAEPYRERSDKEHDADAGDHGMRVDCQGKQKC